MIWKFLAAKIYMGVVKIPNKSSYFYPKNNLFSTGLHNIIKFTDYKLVETFLHLSDN